MPVPERLPRPPLHYLDPNPGGQPVVLLLHGLGANGSSWQLQFPALITAGFRPLAPDTRGFGASPWVGGKIRVTDMVSDLAALLTAIDRGAADIIGISMGGAQALQLALDYPQWVRHLVLVNTFASLRPRHLSVWIYFAWRMLLVHTVGLPAQAGVVARHIFPQPQQAALRQELITQICQADPGGYRATLRALAHFDVSRRLAQISCPALVITGEKDTTVPVSTQARLLGLPHARQVIVPGAGHAVSVEKPQEFNRLLLEFLLETPPKTGVIEFNTFTNTKEING